jgi:AGCS family alanine or glycine:cation symporter
MAGGALGSVIRYGVARGVFSTEVGMGSTPIAAAAAKTHVPAHQGLVSTTGTFIDTIIVCSMTGIILVMGGQYQDGATGAALTPQSFDALLPGWGGLLVTIGLIFFAYSTILGWSYYGEKCAEYLFGPRCVLPYRLIYTVFVWLGSIMFLDLVGAVSYALKGLWRCPIWWDCCSYPAKWSVRRALIVGVDRAPWTPIRVLKTGQNQVPLMNSSTLLFLMQQRIQGVVHSGIRWLWPIC